MNRKVDKLLKKAIAAHQSGDHAAAELGYRKVLRAEPRNINGLYLLGTLRYHQGELQEAEALLNDAIRLEPRFAQAHCNLGLVQQSSGRSDQARASYQMALQLNPNLGEVHNNLGNLYRSMGDLEQALEAFRRASGCDGQNPVYQMNCADTLLQRGSLDEAEAAYRALLVMGRHEAFGHLGLGKIAYRRERLEIAREHLERATGFEATAGRALLLLGITQRRLHQLPEAEATLARAARDGQLEGEAHFHIAGCRFERGDVAGSIRELRRSLAANGDSHHAKSNLLFHLNYLPVLDEVYLYRQHAALAPVGNRVADLVPRPGRRRLRIGYVSPDLRDHSVGYFMLPVARGHDRDRFEVVLVSTYADEGSLMARSLEEAADRWIEWRGEDPQELGRLLDELELDILVELSGYTTENLLQTVATRRAPLQVSYLGYPNTTGLESVDVRIVDRYSDPPGVDEEFYSEKLLRLPESFLCYQPPTDSPPPDRMSDDGGPVFGSFNNLAKINRCVLDAWAEILRAVPESRLMLKTFGFKAPCSVTKLMSEFETRGVAAQRIEIVGPVDSVHGHLEVYKRIDIALDTFPYNGTTTTCEALWMGVPVVVLEGTHHRSRVGYSIMKNVGLPGCICSSQREYVARAIEMAVDRFYPERASVREALRASPLMDGPGFMRSFEGALESAYAESTS